jgi:acyl dehydratase
MTADPGLATAILDADLEQDQRALGYDFADHSQQHFSVATTEVIRNFAQSYGDDNPLFCDPPYGERTRWNGQIGPSIMAGILNAPMRSDPPDPQRRAGRYRGIHVFATGFDWEFFLPMRPDDVIRSFQCLESAEVRDTAFAGRSVFRTQRIVKINQRGEVVAVHRMVGIYAARREAKDRGEKRVVEAASYDQAALDRLDAIYAAEQRRGAEVRWWEDVEAGDALPEMAKGPTTLTDVIAFHAGGYYLTDLRSSRLAYKNRQKKPGFYVPNAQGIPDVVQRVHWDPEWARATGNQTSIDYGAMREHWLHQMLTDWAGDDGWVVAQRVELRKFSLLGDSHVLTGEVIGRRVGQGGGLVDIAMRATSQRGEVTAEGTATIALPSRQHGPVGIAAAPPDIREQASRLLERHLELEASGDAP